VTKYFHKAHSSILKYISTIISDTLNLPFSHRAGTGQSSVRSGGGRNLSNAPT